MVDVIQNLFDHPVLVLQVIATIIGAFLIITIFNKLINRLENRGDLQKGTLVHMKRFFQIVIYLVALMVILSLLNQDITAAIAGLGVGALIIGFGLQDIIQNWVSGILIISGKTYSIGDVIRIGNLTGTVTDIALRTTKLKTYDRNEIIIPNSVLMKEKIINLTSGASESVASLFFATDYTVDAEKAKSIIEKILKSNKSVVFDLKRKREIRFIFRNKEWTNEIEVLFWINDPSNEEFIKSTIAEMIHKEFKKNSILPPVPALMRREFLTGQNPTDEQQTE
ncbi:MAG: mechanosensitive ion channel family protein [Candidatus Bathyarchaeota archaeon]|nr:MAG: mechanosensitive ion channel family protein [Candidatus Bathyarchaeota archaeon]